MSEMNSGPRLVVDQSQLSGVDPSPSSMAAIPGSRMFEIKEALSIFRERHPGVTPFDVSQGDGGASLPGVSKAILDEAHRLQIEHGTGYDKPFGTEEFRRAVVEDYWSLDSTTGWGPTNIIACQGGRDALLKAYEAIQFMGHGRRGDFVVVSRVPWISYNWGPYGVGNNVMLSPGEEDDAWSLSPESIDACCKHASNLGGRKVAAVIITSPDNPTGHAITVERQIELARAAFALGVPFVIFDWIYHRVSDSGYNDLNYFLGQLDPEERERCIFLDGLTKSLGGSNIRNAHLVASSSVVKFIQVRASHGVIPSFHSQAVAIAAYRMGFEKVSASIIEPTNRSRRVLEKILKSHGLRHIIGQGYYAFVDVGPTIDRAGLEDSGDLGARLAEEFGLAVVPGVYFSSFGSRWIRFSYALQPATTEAAGRRLVEALESL